MENFWVAFPFNKGFTMIEVSLFIIAAGVKKKNLKRDHAFSLYDP